MVFGVWPVVIAMPRLVPFTAGMLVPPIASKPMAPGARVMLPSVRNSFCATERLIVIVPPPALKLTAPSVCVCGAVSRTLA